jgi:hypothetical protein
MADFKKDAITKQRQTVLQLSIDKLKLVIFWLLLKIIIKTIINIGMSLILLNKKADSEDFNDFVFS